MIRRLLVVIMAAAAMPVPASAAGLKLADSFRIGSGGVLCTAQSRVADPGLSSMFDRGYRIVCRDAASPVGKLYALRSGADDPAQRLAKVRGADIACAAPGAGDIAELPGVRLAICQQAGLSYSVYSLARGNTLYVAEGLTGYGSALRLGLRGLVTDAAVAGDVEVASTAAGDPAAFARIQAGSLDPGQALAEGYVRNNAGSFAEASEFFDLLVERNRQGSPGFNRSAEYLSNQALQQSNLGNFVEADNLFARARTAIDPGDIVVVRLDRNFRAMHELNRGRPEAARTALQTTRTVDISGLDSGRVAVGYIDVPLSQKLNGDDTGLGRLSKTEARLTPEERAALLDAQARYLEGASYRMERRDAEAMTAFADATKRIDAVRQGKVKSVGWLRAGIATERSIIAERSKKPADARKSLDEAVAVYAADYPGSASLLVAQARLAAFLARQGEARQAEALYAEVIKASPSTPGAGQAVRALVGPYFALLVDRGSPGAGDFFDASQILVRPGVAQTQAVLARELSGGSDAAAGLFRQSVTLSRDIVRADYEIAQLAAKTAPDPGDAERGAALRAQREQLGRDQTAVLAKLSDFPRYRSVANDIVTLKDLQAKLRPGEAYYKLVLVGEDAYALFTTSADAKIMRVGASTSELGATVRALRDTIVKFENGRAATYPFDAMAARGLYKALFAPVDAAMPAVTHLVFEPDGALLQLPVNLLIASDDGLTAYEKRANADDGDAFDMRGIGWLGRDRMVSTAVSPRAFLDVRAFAPSRGTRAYLGLGENAPPPGDAIAPVVVAQGSTQVRTAQTRTAKTRGGITGEAGAAASATRDRCDWPLREWRNPISAAELRIGANLVGRSNSELITGSLFTDTDLEARKDLRDFRVIHFATHGLVTAPRPECPARPALLTSFGAGDSDGLLSFKEVFDLSLDADTIILSACDTAGTATAAATRDAGIATGGNFALDGLVRAFVGAGARAVIASHWPVPDNFDATKTLITGLFSDVGKISVGEALRASQVRLMTAADTSHPYYWSGFAIIGDAAKPLTTSGSASIAAPVPAN
ncbi:MAG: CHAT domain-containing protein [Sandarakinorhabdus sp.]|nr:CHAT domain-containing protein [Sandarakinorhabdus sp.]